MPADFFTRHPDLRGIQEGDYYALCTSTPEVRRWLEDSLAYVFEHVPDLAGVFTITASENLTNCASHGGQARCPHCKNRSPAEIVAEVNQIVEASVHRVCPNARVIVWDWGWNDTWADEVIRLLPKTCAFMSVSEWSKPIERGGVKTTVGEYSLSAPGPGPRAEAHWRVAKESGLKTIAKIQVNATWELSAVPYLPVMDLVAAHAEGLRTAGVDGLMLSWTVGGYPSPNLELLHQADLDPFPGWETILNNLAQHTFGAEGAPFARRAWTAFSRAFQGFPFNTSVLYHAPQQFGPSNLLYPRPTGYAATMVGFPYDDVDKWRGPYPPEIFAQLWSNMAQSWAAGLDDLQQAVDRTPDPFRLDAQAQLRFARAARLHFASTANQVLFTLRRNDWLANHALFSPEQRQQAKTELRRLILDEMDLARELYLLAWQDSRIGYEASNQYYYLPIDLLEKGIQCRYLLDHLNDLYPDEM